LLGELQEDTENQTTGNQKGAWYFTRYCGEIFKIWWDICWWQWQNCENQLLHTFIDTQKSLEIIERVSITILCRYRPSNLSQCPKYGRCCHENLWMSPCGYEI